MRTGAPVFAGLLALAAKVGRADPTWPAPTDEMEEIAFQLQGFRGRLFNDQITPCNNEAAGPGRVTAAEWLRIGFHDMATQNVQASGGATGGLDGSIQYEVANSENTGPGHNTTLKWFSNFLSERSSIADLIATGVYASVRGCGGPIVPLRFGRTDATANGPLGVPQPENSATSFRNAFLRMGLTAQEGIQLTACGHTLGGVHNPEFPNLVPANVGTVGLDSTPAAFDNKVVTEYLDGTTTNVLVKAMVDLSFARQRLSDFKVFNSDGNVTVTAMAQAAAFNSVCANVLQKMIDTVPRWVTLSDPIVPYTIKPVDLQLTLAPGGSNLALSGYIRLRTTNIPIATVKDLTLTWKDRAGGNNCGSGSCSRTFTHQGASRGFDDTFVFYPIDITFPASSGISSFTVRLNMNDGSSQNFDNNGNGYPLSDGVILQTPQTCLSQGNGALTATALVRNDITETPELFVSYLEPRTRFPTPLLTNATITMTEGDCVGPYTFYSAQFTIPGGLSHNARITVRAGSEADDFNKAADYTGTCAAFVGSATCTNNVTPSSVSSSVLPSSTSSTSTRSSTSSTSSSPTGTPTPSIPPTVGGYNFVSCWTEGTGVRALSGAAYAYDGMTLESCMGNCTGFDYWGTEYGRECYCGNTLAASSQSAPVGECNMLCSGNAFEFCGAGNRLVLYATTSIRPSSTSSTMSVPTTSPTSTGTTTSSTTSTSSIASSTATTLARKPTVGLYTLVGCQTEATGMRALSANSYAADTMTLESCATFCSGYTYFGTEYGRECYCGNTLNAGSVPATQADCSMTCAGNPFEYCGAGNRLELYKLTVAMTSSSSSSSSSTSSSSSSSSSSTTSTRPTTTSSSTTSTSAPTTSSTSTTTTRSSTSTTSSSASTSSTITTNVLSHKPTISPFTLKGCYTEGTGARALADKSYASAAMTLQSCATFCSGYKYFGTEYASECFCGNTLHATSTNVSLSECNMPCSGHSFQYCGAGNRLELYIDEDYTPPTTPSGPSHPPTLSGGWSFYNCMTEGSAGRALAAKSYASGSAMTLDACATFCEGYTYFGTEYASECYCGNSFSTGSVVAGSVTDCGMTCSGNSNQYCGAGNRLSVYTHA